MKDKQSLRSNDLELSTTNQFVSRGGIKLQAALDKFQINVKDQIVLDVGSSTGGFVDCLLQNGAEKVYAVDTCYGELAWKLRNNPKVVVMERTNILHLDYLPDHTSGEPRPRLLSPEHSDGGQVTPDVQEAEKDTWKVGSGSFQVNSRMVNLITIDAGWTKLELVLPVVKKFLKKDGLIIALLKPHYEADKRSLPFLFGKGKKDLIKGVLPPEKAEEVKNQIAKKIYDLGFEINEETESPILGGGGNQEYLLLLKQK